MLQHKIPSYIDGSTEHMILTQRKKPSVSFTFIISNNIMLMTKQEDKQDATI